MTTLPVLDNYVDGAWAAAASRFTPRNPSDLSAVAEVADSGEADVDAAVRAARAAFPAWSVLNPSVRAAHLHDAAAVVRRREEELSRAVTTEMGKTHAEALGEVRKLADAFDYYAEEATRVHGEVIPNDVDGYTSIVRHEPIGVVGAITPWNYPLELVGWKLCAALAAGCTIVVRPSELSPLSVTALFSCLEESGLPGGVANLLHGERATARLLVAHPDLDKIAFTGSTATGDAIARSLPSAKPLSMELGGSCPMIVTAHADVAAAVRGAARRGFRNAGQICIAVNRIYVHRAVHEEFVEALTATVAAIRVGDGHDPAVDMGPMTTAAGLDVVEDHVQDALAHGARVTTGGTRLDVGPGHFWSPTVVDGCDPSMRILTQETFGPAVGVMAVDDLDTAVDLANGTSAGLAAYLYTSDLGEAFDLGHRLDFGSVAVDHVDAGIMNAPYGGRKGSGYGSEHGREGLHGYLQLKHLRLHHGGRS